jgi:hypothetical protein
VTARRQRSATVAVAVALVLLVAGCTGSAPTTPGPPSTSSSASTSATTPPSPEDLAKSQVLAFLPTYFKTIDDLYVDPSTALNSIYSVSSAREATIELNAAREFRLSGYRQTGYTKLVKSDITGVDLTNKPNAKPAIRPTVRVTTCVDVTNVRATDKHGTSIVPKDRKQYLISQLQVVNFSYPSASGWSVTHAPNKSASSCGA